MSIQNTKVREQQISKSNEINLVVLSQLINVQPITEWMVNSLLKQLKLCFNAIAKREWEKISIHSRKPWSVYLFMDYLFHRSLKSLKILSIILNTVYNFVILRVRSCYINLIWKLKYLIMNFGIFFENPFYTCYLIV